MKTKFIYLGILTTLFISTSFADTVVSKRQSLQSELLKLDSVSEVKLVSDTTLKKPSANFELEADIKASISTVSSNYQQPIEEIIAENKKIIESPEYVYQPLYLETTIDDVIKFNNEVIESPMTNEVHPLDFNLINKGKKSDPKENLNITHLHRNALKTY